MSTRLEKIYSDYISADFADRLYLYLQFPELRNDFFEIEQTAAKEQRWHLPRVQSASPAE